MSVILDFAKTLQMYVDSGLINPTTRVLMHDTFMEVNEATTENAIDIDVETLAEAKSPIAKEARLQGKSKTAAAAVFEPQPVEDPTEEGYPA